MDVLIVMGVVVVILIGLYFYTSMAVKYGGEKTKAAAAEKKITDWKNLSKVVAKKLEKYEKPYQTLSNRIDRAYSSDDLAKLMHEVWDGVGTYSAPGVSEEPTVQGHSKKSVVSPKRK